MEFLTRKLCVAKSSTPPVTVSSALLSCVRVDVDPILGQILGYEGRRSIDRLAPETIKLPCGRDAPVDYGRVGPPVASARIQELFGLRQGPRVMDGTVAVAFELLAPNQRPVQLTDDLAGFWERTYPQVRRELRGRYPKHDWPEDPWTATASSRTRRRRPKPGGSGSGA